VRLSSGASGAELDDEEGPTMSGVTGAFDEFLTTVFERIGRFIVRAPGLVLGAIAVITVVMATFIPTLRFNNDGRIYFIEGDKMVEAQDRFEQTFGSEQFVMFFVESPDLFTVEGYKIVDELVKALAAAEWKGKPAFTGTLDPFHAPALKPGSGSLDFSPIVAVENPSEADIAAAKNLVINHPVYARSLVNRDGSIGVVMATMQALPNDQAYSQFIADKANEIFETVPGLKTTLKGRLVGAPVFGSEMNKVTAQESVIFGSASVLVCILALLLMFRRVAQVFGTILVVVISTIWTVGAMALIGTEMSLIHAILPPAIIVTGLGSGIHVVNEFRLFATKLPRTEALVFAVRSMGGPCFLTAITTATGFVSMLAAPVAPMRTLGLYISLGVLLSFVLAMFFVPAVLALGKASDDAEAPSRLRDLADKSFHRLGEIVVAHAPLITIGFFILAVALAAGMSRITVDTNFLHALRSDHPFRETVEYVDDRMGGSSSMELIVDTGAPGGVYDPVFVARLAELQRWVEASQDDVVWVTLSIVDLLKEINYAVAGKRQLPETRSQVAELMFLYEVGGGITKNVVDAERRVLRMSARTKQMSSMRSSALEAALREKATELFKDTNPAKGAVEARDASTADATTPPPRVDDDDDTIQILEEDEEADEVIILDDDAPTPPPKAPVAASAPAHDNASGANTAPDGTVDGKTDPSKSTARVEKPIVLGPPTFEIAGSTPLFAKLNEYVISSQLTSFTIAAIVISLFMMLMLRSIRLGLTIMIPNVLPILATYGLMGWVGIPMDFMLAVIAVAAIGVAVDGTIHIGTRYRRARALGENSSEAAISVLTSVGRALVVTALALAAGFCVLAPSVMATLANFGLLMSFCLVLALLFDLIMTPAILSWLGPKNSR
jgi:predicted RND superfamily exporter protein